MHGQTAGQRADHFPWEQLIAIAPQILAALIVAALLIALGATRIRRLLARVTKLGLFGFEIELASQVEALTEDRVGSSSRTEAAFAANTLNDAAHLLSCSRILWVDDNPKGNSGEMRILRHFCVQIDIARTTEDARIALDHGIYDIVLSDMDREGSSLAGEEMPRLIEDLPLPPHLIYYVGRTRPQGASFGLTTRPDELFSLIVRALRDRSKARPVRLTNHRR